MTDEWFDTVRKTGRRKIYMQGLREEVMAWAKEQDIGHMAEIHEILPVIKPKYKKSYVEYLRATSKVKNPKKGAFTGPAGTHTKSKFDGRAIGISRAIHNILIRNGWVKNKNTFVKIHDKKGKVRK